MSTGTGDLVDVVVEIPRGSRNKYEYDEQRGVMRFDRRLLGAIAFPADYGYVPETIGADGDALHALVLLDESTFPGVWVTSRPIAHVTEEIGQFFEVYKGLDKHSSSTDEGREGRESALRVVEEARERWRSAQEQPS